ncbi:MAG TPA: hypothetical protein VFO05_13820 [Candidatus Limnocylindrales bacterium]|nr:hypothetical protein [Candidatus Limnocylindrales bacterium]
MTALGELLAGLPPPLGPLVTGSLPLVAGASLYLSVNAYRMGRRRRAVAIAAVGLAALVAGLAYYTYRSGSA